MVKRIIHVIILVLIGAFVFYMVRRTTHETVAVYRAQIEPYTHYIYSNIEIQPKHLYEIGVPSLPDTIVALPWEVGDHVKKGDILLRLDTKEEELKKERIFAQEACYSTLSKIKSSTEWALITNNEELNYMLEEFNKNTVPEIEIRKLRDRLSALENRNKREQYYEKYRLDRLEISKDNVENAVENNIVVSPITGVIANIYKEPGEYLAVGEVAMEIFQDSNLQIIGEVFEEDIEYLSVGKLAVIELNAFPGQEFHGKIEMIFPKNDQEMQKIEVLLTSDDLPENIAPGLKGLASFEVAYSDSEVVVPSTAVFRSAVQLVENGRIKVRPVEMAVRGLFQNVIRNGLPEGSIILEEYRTDLKDGQRVDTFFRPSQ